MPKVQKLERPPALPHSEITLEFAMWIQENFDHIARMTPEWNRNYVPPRVDPRHPKDLPPVPVNFDAMSDDERAEFIKRTLMNGTYYRTDGGIAITEADR